MDGPAAGIAEARLKSDAAVGGGQRPRGAAGQEDTDARNDAPTRRAARDQR